MTKSAKLLERLRKELELEISDSAKIVRTHAGRWMRIGGAWSWMLVDEGNRLHLRVGGADRVSDLYQCPKLTTYPCVDLTCVSCNCPAGTGCWQKRRLGKT